MVPECNVNSSTTIIHGTLKTVELAEIEEVGSVHIASLYAILLCVCVPAMEAIEVCTEFIYSEKYSDLLVDCKTFITLVYIATCNVLMSTYNGFH